MQPLLESSLKFVSLVAFSVLFFHLFIVLFVSICLNTGNSSEGKYFCLQVFKCTGFSLLC